MAQQVGDEIAVKCPPVPPYPEGWYSGTVVGVAIEDGEGLDVSNTKASPTSSEKAKNFTIHVEWDGGGEETLRNPEWRMKGDAPDKQGRVSHRDAKVGDDFHLFDSNQLLITLNTDVLVSLCVDVHSFVLILSTGSTG